MGLALDGKAALVTGGAMRLGKATVVALARAGAYVVVHYNQSAQKALQLKKELTTSGEIKGRIECIGGDLSNPVVAEQLVQKAADLIGRPISILINNASIFPSDTLAEMTLASINDNVAVNAFAPLALMRAFSKQCQSGTVVNLLDSRYVDNDKEHAAYHLSKRMLFTLTRMAAVEYAPQIRVNAVAPGLVLPPAGEDDAYLKQKMHTLPLKQHGCSTDVVKAVLFLLDSPFVTGQVIFVDGGRHMRTALYS